MVDGTRSRFRLEIAALTDVGRERTRNDDNYLVVGEPAAAFGVCDGMGGHAGGDVASRIAVDSISDVLTGALETEPGLDARLRCAIAVASRRILAAAARDPALHRMGTTATIAALDGDELVVAQVGDSRAYLLRDGELRRLTRDQTLAQALADQGQIGPEEIESSDYAHIILEAVGVNELPGVELGRTALAAGDVILVCSDGLSGPLGDAVLREILARPDPPEALAQTLVDRANEAGGPDNITCVVARVFAAPAAARDSEPTLPALPMRRFWWWP